MAKARSCPTWLGPNPPRRAAGLVTGRWILLAFGFTATLLIASCQGGAAEPTPHPALRTTPAASASPASAAGEEAVREQEYRELINQLMDGIGQMTRIIGGISIGLAGRPEGAAEEKETVDAVIGSLELARERLQGAEPPPGYEGLHQTLLEALSFYTQASTALLPVSQTGKADYPRFQELMLQGGKNFHAAGTELSDLARPRD